MNGPSMTGRAALVTGGSRGIGAAIVKALAADGWQVVAASRSGRLPEGLDPALAGQVRAVALDVADPKAPDSAIREITASVGPIACLVNNAGLRHDALLATTKDDDWNRLIDVNISGAFRCSRAVLPGMVARRDGVIVNVSSLAALAGLTGQAAYGATKAAMLGMTRALAREVGRRNIRVNAVLPGFVATDMTADMSPDAVQRLRSTECLPQGTTPADVAAVVAFLASPRAAAITGQAIVVDSGASA